MTRRRALAVGLSLVLLGATACAGKGGATSAPTTRATSTADGPASTGPSAREWLADLEPVGASLYVTSHSCPGKVAAGLCTVQAAFGNVPPLKAFPLTLWRYTDERWEDLGQPGVFSYAEMMRVPGGLLFVPRTHTEAAGFQTTGPLRLSLDEGRTWESWPIPQQPRRCRTDYSGPGGGPCSVAVAGDYVFVTSNFGWIRRNIRSGGWEDVALPERARVHEFDAGGYGLLTLDDGTLIATANNPFSDSPKGFFRVSKDFGSTWSAPRANPGRHSDLGKVDGSVLYAECQDSSCGWYRSADLEHWRKATAAELPSLNDGRPFACRAPLRAGPSWRHPDAVARVGSLVYGITYVPYLNGHEATAAELPNPDLPHRARHVLEQSADSCATWAPVPSGPSS
ncbi:MAG TPA: sialidase family protein [Mycobacteriales bacterium]|nr:sialidase family protein [Mycobacteriales bacterium]